jgi:hypothetical protein
MCAKLSSRGFHRKRQEPADGDCLLPAQYLIADFPVLSAGPTPYTPEQE